MLYLFYNIINRPLFGKSLNAEEVIHNVNDGYFDIMSFIKDQQDGEESETFV